MTRTHSAAVLLFVIGIWFYVYSSYTIGYSHATRNDFAHLYVAGFLANRGGNFFDFELFYNTYRYLQIPSGLNPYVYPPFFAIVLIPISSLSYDAAWQLFSGLSHLAYFISIACVVKIVRANLEEHFLWWGILFALSGIFYPLFKTYSAGQMNTIMLMIIAAGLYCLMDKKDISAGIFLGFGAAIKITPVFLLIFCVWKKRYHAAIAGLIVIGLTVCVSLSMLPLEVHGDFLTFVMDMGYGKSTWSNLRELYGFTSQSYHVDPFNQAPSAMWYRLFTTTETSGGTIRAVAEFPTAACMLSYATAILCVALLFWKTDRASDRFLKEEYSLWTIGMLLIPSLLWDHYLVQLMLPIAVAIQRALADRVHGVVVLSISISILAMPFLHNNPAYYEGWMTLVMSIKLLGIVLLSGFLLTTLSRQE